MYINNYRGYRIISTKDFPAGVYFCRIISTKDFPAGVYFCRITNSYDINEIVKFVIEH
jgi:hypothetical protein